MIELETFMAELAKRGFSRPQAIEAVEAYLDAMREKTKQIQRQEELRLAVQPF